MRAATPSQVPDAVIHATAALEEIRCPLGAVTEGRCWYTPARDVVSRLGCWSHAGPPWIVGDKPNEDFAFAIQHEVHGEIWSLIGVADGVSNSTWAERGAQHAAAAFLECTVELLEVDAAGELALRDSRFRRAALLEPLRERVLRRFERDADLIVAARLVHASWEQHLYERTFFDGAAADDNRLLWFQTTLLAAALGPRGGFALLLGDGLVRIDRARGSDRDRAWLELDPIGASESAGPISRWLTTDDLGMGYRGIPVRDAEALEILVATDGAVRTPAHELEKLTPRDGEDCRRFLEALAARPRGQVESDNMSIAFANRRVGG